MQECAMSPLEHAWERRDRSRLAEFTLIELPVAVAIIGEAGCYFPSGNPISIPPQTFRHFKYGDTRGNVTFADSHAGFIRFIYESDVRNMSGPDYMFDRTK